MAEILTHAAFYAGWPKAWAAFRAWQRNLSGLRRKNIMLGNFSYSNPTKLYFGEESLCSLNEGLPKIWENRSVNLWRWFYQEKWYLQSGYEITER